MATLITPAGFPIPTFKYLNDIVTILGTSKQAFWPFLQNWGSIDNAIWPYGAGSSAAVAYARDEAATRALEAEFDPIKLVGGINAYYFDSSGNCHINANDAAAYSHGNGTTDTAMSLGCWIYPTEALGTARTLIAKFGSTANAEEYRLQFDASGNILFELHDASASQKELATGASDVIVPWAWNFVVATYDGAQAAPDVHLYRNASDQNATGATVEDGGAGYTAMEGTASKLLIGCDDDVGTPANEFEGFMALPILTGKELSAAEVTTLEGIGGTLIGLV